MADSRVRAYLVQLKLLEMGDIEKAKEISSEKTSTSNVAMSEITDILNDDEASKEEAEVRAGAGGKHSKESGDVTKDAILTAHEKRFAAFCCLSNEMKKKACDKYARNCQRDTITAFHKAITGISTKCENCGTHSPKFRKDGFTKIFRKSQSSRVKQNHNFR